MSRRTLSRRAFLKIALASTVQTTVAGVGVFAYAHDVEPGSIDVHPVALTLPRLAPAFDGYRVVQISDIHIGEWMTRSRLADVVSRVNRQQPDLVVITGDFVTAYPDYYADDLILPLRQLAPRDGTLAILGNHDHWTNAGTVREIIDAAGLVNVSNDVYTLERGGARQHFAGIDDYWEGHDRLDLVLERLPAGEGAVLLAHEPDFADISAATGRFDAQLSGHSHGGQVIIPVIGPVVLPHLSRKYPVGQYQVGSMIQYTNRGVGMISPEVRFNCRPEVTVFTLRSTHS
jgi:predicted MPP superfamily phosphohydrolase